MKNFKHMQKLARKALEERMAEIGKGMDEILPMDAAEVVYLAAKDATLYPEVVDLKVWMTGVVSSGGPGVLRLNI